MAFTPELARTLKAEHSQVTRDLHLLTVDLISNSVPSLTSPRAKEYLAHGLCRRLKVIARCLVQVFEICPPSRAALLERDERTDLEIALHAFAINVHGALDNLAWVVVFEKTPGTMDRRKVGLLKKDVRPLLPAAAASYLQDPKILTWYKDYSANYRDALAHRIPLYVPPASLLPAEQKQYEDLEEQITAAFNAADIERAGELLEQQSQLGVMYPVFAHSFGDSDTARPTYFHGQLIIDGKTLMEIVRLVLGP